MQKTALVVLSLAGFGLSAPARAEITVFKARYAAGVLVVNGETSRPNQRVSLDGRYFTRTNKYKKFLFRVRYLPNDCTVRITAGGERRPAVVAGCSIKVRPTS